MAMPMRFHSSQPRSLFGIASSAARSFSMSGVPPRRAGLVETPMHTFFALAARHLARAALQGPIIKTTRANNFRRAARSAYPRHVLARRPADPAQLLEPIRHALRRVAQAIDRHLDVSHRD